MLRAMRALRLLLEGPAAAETVLQRARVLLAQRVGNALHGLEQLGLADWEPPRAPVHADVV